MTDRRSALNLKRHFTEMLHRAITHGQMPVAGEIGPLTSTAIERVAVEHPEASPLDVARAYDAFQREHGDGADDVSARRRTPSLGNPTSR